MIWSNAEMLNIWLACRKRHTHTWPEQRWNVRKQQPIKLKSATVCAMRQARVNICDKAVTVHHWKWYIC